MKNKLCLTVVLIFIVGCASTSNSRWFEGAMMSFQVVELGPMEYKLFAYGAGAHKKEEVERGFLVRAGELCNGAGFNHEFGTEPYQYRSYGNGYSFTHTAFKSIGIIKCNKNP